MTSLGKKRGRYFIVKLKLPFKNPIKVNVLFIKWLHSFDTLWGDQQYYVRGKSIAHHLMNKTCNSCPGRDKPACISQTALWRRQANNAETARFRFFPLKPKTWRISKSKQACREQPGQPKHSACCLMNEWNYWKLNISSLTAVATKKEEKGQSFCERLKLRTLNMSSSPWSDPCTCF